MTPYPLSVGSASPRNSLTKRLLQNSQPDPPQMTRHHFLLENIGHQDNPMEQVNKYIEVLLNPLWIPQPNETITQMEYPQATTNHMS